MSSRPQWSYAQARLQARYGDRLRDEGWSLVEAAGSVDQVIERVHDSSLSKFTHGLNGRMSTHAMERLLRSAWREHVDEVARWAPEAWRPVVMWCAYLPDLQVVQALLKGETPQWAMQDADFKSLVGLDMAAQRMTLERSPLRPLAPSLGPETEIAGRWYAYWESLWPDPDSAERRSLFDLVKMVKAYVARLARAAPQETSGRARQELTQAIVPMFRRHGASPIALFCYLLLVRLDLERLRGGLIRRRLFAPIDAVAGA